MNIRHGGEMGGARMDIELFYELLSRLKEIDNQGASLAQLIANKKCLPKQGVYFFLEPGESIPLLGGKPRIVRVGTHAVSAGAKSTLYSRLKSHFGGKSGTGNHRGSVFRKHVGNAMLKKEKQIIPTWGQGSIAPAALRADPDAQKAEADWERKISQYIGEMSILWVDVPGESSSTNLRAFIEKNAIALLSNHTLPEFKASSDWLGQFSTEDKIRSSLLWNVKHVDAHYDPQFLVILAEVIKKMHLSGAALNS